MVLVSPVIFEVLEVKAVDGARLRALLPHVTVKVDHADKLTQLFAGFWNCEGLNGLNFLWYGHNSVTSDVITKIVKLVGAKA